MRDDVLVIPITGDASKYFSGVLFSSRGFSEYKRRASRLENRYYDNYKITNAISHEIKTKNVRLIISGC